MNVLNVGYDSTNYYLVGPNDARLLVDAGMPGTFPELQAILRRRDVPLASIRHLLCTHYHPDHAGIAQALKRAGVRLIVLDAQAAAVPALNAFMKRHGWDAEIALHDNLSLRLEESRAFLRRLGVDGEVVATPGHSDDSVSLLLDDGAAFTGDLPPPGLGEDEAMAALLAESWARLRQLGATRVYPGHGPTAPL